MNNAIVLFSGGIDSAYTAVKSLKSYEKLLLITYKTPGMINLHLSKQTAQKIENIFKDKIEHHIIDIQESVFLSRGNIIKCIKDNLKYNFFYSWCLGCKLGMHLKTIEICLQKNIYTVLDGSSFYDAHALEQQIECKNFFTKLYTEKGIKFISPFYYDSGKEKTKSLINRTLAQIGLYKPPTGDKASYLKKIGIDLGPFFFSQYRSIQPSCVTSLVFNLPRIFLKIFFKENKEGYMKYLDEVSLRYKK